jgi:hypothetical protein
MDSDVAAVLQDESIATPRESFPVLLARLSQLSVTKHHDAYADVPWDDPQSRIEAEDPVWELGPDHPLGVSPWYAEQPPEVRARIGLHFVACAMQTGAEFENVLTRGLLNFAVSLPRGAPEYRYAYHEAIEESQHTLMFREFVSRAGLDVEKPSAIEIATGRRVARLGRRFPELFFFYVLGGEDPIDYVQRAMLGSSRPVHPLLRRMMQIHVTEEARHLCFARAYLRERVPALGTARRARLSFSAPLVLGSMARRMLLPPAVIVRTYRIPREVLTEAYRRGPVHRADVRKSLEKVRALCESMGLLSPVSRAVWQVMGIA